MLVTALSGAGEVPQLLVGSRLVGPRPGVPLLWVIGDVGPQPKEMALQQPAAQSDLRKRVMRAVLPVVDLLFEGQTLRILPGSLPWKGMPGATMSSPLNMVELVERLSRAAGGALVDLRFEGVGPSFHADWASAPDGADHERWQAFLRYSANQASQFVAGALGQGSPGQLSVIGAPAQLANAAGPATPPSSQSIPWQAAPKKPRAPWPVGIWLFFGLVGLAALLNAKNQRLGLFWTALCGLAALISGLRALSTLERLLAVPLAKVRSAALGPVELCGRVLGSAPFPSPHSGLTCAWLRWVIEELRTDSKGNKSWSTISHGEVTQVPFHLDDGTGGMLVQPAGAEVEVGPVVTSLGPRQRAREWMILEGGTFFVYGMAQRRQHDERRANLQERLRASKHDPALRASVGVPTEGELTMEDWDRLRARVQSVFDSEVAAEERQPDEVFVGVSPAGAIPSIPLLISELSRQSQLGRLRLRLWGGVIGGGALLLVAFLSALHGIR
jgi:hypothetical protein